MIKLFLILLIVAVAGGFIINKVSSFKQNLIEFINPAVKEGRVLGELKENLVQLDASLGDLNNAKNLTELKSKTKITSEIIEKSKNLLNTASEINNQDAGIFHQAISKIINTFVDKTPFPADHLVANEAGLIIPIANGTPVVCPIVKPN